MAKAYADDLTLMANNLSDCQFLCHQTNKWLLWTVTMSAKPTMKITSLFKTQSIHFLTLDPPSTTNQFNFHFKCKQKDEFKSKHFKFLGRWIPAYPNKKHISTKIKESILNEMEIVDKTLVNGIMKFWMYQFYVLYHFS